MRVEKLVLSNFRGQRNLSLHFQPGFNLIVGINGAGKTTILDALRILLARALPGFSSASSFPGIGLIKQDISIGRASTYIQADFKYEENGYSLVLSEQDKKYLSRIDKEIGFKKISDINLGSENMADRHKRLRLKKGDPRLEGTARKQTSELLELSGEIRPAPDKAFKKSKSQPLVLFCSVRRSITTEKVVRGQPSSLGYQGIFDVERGLDLGRLIHWWKGREEITKEEASSKSAKQLGVINLALKRMLPELSNWRIEDGTLKLDKMADLERINSAGEHSREKEKVSIPAKFLSDGERSLLAICVDISQRLVLLNEDSESPLDVGEGVVLIDELDLHLHPKWQRRIVEDLRRTFPSLQFICTTHSPFIIQSLRDASLIQLDTNEDDILEGDLSNSSLEDVVENIQGVEMPQRSLRYLKMFKAAGEYFTLLRVAPENETKLGELKLKLDELSIPFSDDPAFQALLKQERIAAIGTER